MPMHGLQMLVGLALWSRRCTPRNREFACLDRIAPRQFPQMKRLVKPTVPTPSPARYGHDIALSGELIPPDRLSRQGEICALPSLSPGHAQTRGERKMQKMDHR
jgi:hypothetical protein